MKNILTIKTWLTIDDAIKHLSQVCNETITREDIYIFAKEHDLTLSLLCIGGVKAKYASVFSEPVLSELPFGGSRLLGEFVKDGCYIHPDSTNSHTCAHIDGIVDLLTIGSGMALLEENLLNRNEYVLMDYVYVRTMDDNYLWLVDSYQLSSEIVKFDPLKERITFNYNYIPIAELPKDAQLGIRTSELNLFINKLLNQNEQNKETANNLPAKRNGVSPDKLNAKLTAAILAEYLWRQDKDQIIKIKDMAIHVYTELYQTEHQRQLPDKPESLKDWIKDVAPPYARESGRPPKK